MVFMDMQMDVIFKEMGVVMDTEMDGVDMELAICTVLGMVLHFITKLKTTEI